MAPEHAADITTFEQRQIERHFRDLAGGETDHQKAAFPRDRTQGGFRVSAANGIEDDIGALAAGEPP